MNIDPAFVYRRTTVANEPRLRREQKMAENRIEEINSGEQTIFFFSARNTHTIVKWLTNYRIEKPHTLRYFHMFAAWNMTWEAKKKKTNPNVSIFFLHSVCSEFMSLSTLSHLYLKFSYCIAHEKLLSHK